MAQLTAPTISATLIDGIDIQISGISSSNASGYKVRWGTLSGYGREEAITPTSGSFTIDDTFARTTYYIAVMAVGDGVDYEDSGWSNEVQVVTEGTVDSSITAPTVTVNAASYAYVDFNGITRWKLFRYQVATTADGFANVQPGLIHGIYGSDIGSVYGLEAGTTYYFRFCEVQGKRCSPWTTAISRTTSGGWTNTIVVTSADASGDGTLRAAIQSAQSNTTRIVFDSSLDGATIYPTSDYTMQRSVFIDASDLPHGITIDGGGTCVGFTNTEQYYPSVWRGVTFKNSKAPSNSFSYCTLIECTFKDITSDLLYDTRCYHCVFDGSTVAIQLNRAYGVGCVLKGLSLKAYCFQETVACNSYISDCSVGGGTFGITRMAYCCIVDSTQTSTQNLVEAAYGCYFKGITQSSSSKYAYLTAYGKYCYFDCNGYTGKANTGGDCDYSTFVGCAGSFVANAANKVITGCKIYTRDATTHPWFGSSFTLKDSLVWYTVDVGDSVIYTNCTIYRANYRYSSATQINTTINNSLVGPGMIAAIPGTNNLVWDETDTTSANYVGKIFVDYANGDYRLKLGSPAINAGDDQYVTSGDLDLAGNARINGTAVDVGAYEFYSSQLDPPTFTVTPGAGGSGSVSFVLPEGGVSFLLETATESTFANPTQYTATTSPVAVSGCSGTVYFRAKTIGATADEDSDWSAVTTAFFDATPPVITFSSFLRVPYHGNDGVYTPSGLFTVTDDVTINPTYHWYFYLNNELVTVNGQSEDLLFTQMDNAGVYTLKVEAVDAAGNVGRGEATINYRLPRPTISIATGAGGTATITFTPPAEATGFDGQYKHNNDNNWTTITGISNPWVITGLDGYYQFQVRYTSTLTDQLTSPWSSLGGSTLLDATPPVLTIPETAADLTVGATVDLMSGVSATDAQTANPTIHYVITDANGQTVVIGGQTQDLATNLLSPGTYTIIYSASDETGNIATAERPLKVRLAAPTYTFNAGANGTATINYVLPEGAVGCDVRAFREDGFEPIRDFTDVDNPFIVSGLNGWWSWWLKSVSPTGTYDSFLTAKRTYHLDSVTPIVQLEDRSPVEYVVGDDSVDLLSGVTATDDYDQSVAVHYYLTDATDQIIEVDGDRQDIPSDQIPIGAYKVVYEAEDSSGNKGYADRGLLVLPTVLTTPVIACVGLYNTTATISGLNVSNAYGYALDVDGEVTTIDVPSDGTYAITNLADNASHTIRVKALGDWIFPEPPTPPSGHYRDSAWSNVVTVIIGNPADTNAPVITKTHVTDRSITIGVSNYEATAGYFEIVIAEDKTFSSPIVLTKVPADEITIKGLKASTIYYTKLRAVFAESTTPWSNVLLYQTEDLGPITPQDKLLYIRERIGLLRAYLADISNIDSVSIDGISESKYDREKLLKELADLEAEESRLVNGGGRLTTMDIRWTIL